MPKSCVETLFYVCALWRKKIVRGRVGVTNIGMWSPRQMHMKKDASQWRKVTLFVMKLSKVNEYHDQELKGRRNITCLEK